MQRVVTVITTPNQMQSIQLKVSAAIAAGVQGPDLQAEVDRLNASSARLAAAALAITPGGGGGVGTGGGSGEGGGGVTTGG